MNLAANNFYVYLNIRYFDLTCLSHFYTLIEKEAKEVSSQSIFWKGRSTSPMLQ